MSIFDTFPAHFGYGVTPTLHHKVPANLDPSQVKLPNPFVAVVTGAGKGIGYGTALAFARAGASGLSISSRTTSDLAALESELLTINPNLFVLKTVCDTQSDESVAALVDAVTQKFGRVDVVVANAGTVSKYVTNSAGSTNLPYGILEDADWNRVLDVNLSGTWRTARGFFPLLAATTDGPQTLVNVTSMVSHTAFSAIAPPSYNISKLASCRLIEHLDADHREKDGIHAYSIHPGAVLTAQTQGHEGGAYSDKGVWLDDAGLPGAMCVWLAREKKSWLSGRYVKANWDVDELAGRKEEIAKGDLLKFRMVV